MPFCVGGLRPVLWHWFSDGYMTFLSSANLKVDLLFIQSLRSYTVTEFFHSTFPSMSLWGSAWMLELFMNVLESREESYLVWNILTQLITTLLVVNGFQPSPKELAYRNTFAAHRPDLYTLAKCQEC